MRFSFWCDINFIFISFYGFWVETWFCGYYEISLIVVRFTPCLQYSPVADPYRSTPLTPTTLNSTGMQFNTLRWQFNALFKLFIDICMQNTQSSPSKTIYEGAHRQHNPLSDDVRRLTPFATLQMQIQNFFHFYFSLTFVQLI